MSGEERIVRSILEAAGIEVNGSKPWDMQVHDQRIYGRVLARRSLGLGEAYMDGWWDCQRVDQLIHKLLKSQADRKVKPGWRLWPALIKAVLVNRQSRSRSKEVAERHYDLGNDLFGAFLDPCRQYSCGYFQDTDDLGEAQEKKMRLLCDKLELKPGDRLLDIGCGWGGLARFACEHYGAQVIGVNISRRQIEYAKEHCDGLDVEIRRQDYRDLDEPFDKVVSVGMFEHVGPRNYPEFMDAVARCLKPGGIFVLHTIGNNRTTLGGDPWIDRYIFPNGKLPTVAQIARASEGLFVLEDLHNLGPHYDKTLMRWLGNFRTAWPRLAERYGERFRRMWEYYLQCCAGAFRARDIQLWQVVFTPEGTDQPCCGRP